MLQCNHKERSSYPLRCNMRSPCVIPSSRKIHRFFCAIFILLLACVSAKYLKGSRMQSVPSCTFSQNRAFVCFLSIVYCWFLWFFRPPFLYSWHPFFAFVIYFVSRTILSTILGYISKPLHRLTRAHSSLSCAMDK